MNRVLEILVHRINDKIVSFLNSDNDLVKVECKQAFPKAASEIMEDPTFQKPKIIPKFATPNKILENSGVSTDSSENTLATTAKLIE